jgi:hypothetical protein
MKQELRNGMPGRRGPYPLALGLIASALLHLLFVLLNPGMEAPSYGRAGGTPSRPGAQFTVLSLSPHDEDDLIQLEATPRTATLRTPPFGTPGAAPVEAGGSGRGTGPETGADVTVAERLRYRARPFSAPVAPMREPDNQRALRETRERVRRAGEELGPLPPNGVARSRGGGGSGGGISIPFGFKPPPPAQTVPAPPLPDSIVRQDSIRAAARAAVRRDSLRAARDTTRLRNVAPRRPVVIPRVVRDTTARKR